MRCCQTLLSYKINTRQSVNHAYSGTATVVCFCYRFQLVEWFESIATNFPSAFRDATGSHSLLPRKCFLVNKHRIVYYNESLVPLSFRGILQICCFDVLRNLSWRLKNLTLLQIFEIFFPNLYFCNLCLNLSWLLINIWLLQRNAFFYCCF